MEVRGSLLRVDGREVSLDREERGLARLLAEVPGGTVTEAAILERLWRAAPVEGPQVVEAGVARLKDKLGVAGSAITSPNPGSYRWAAERVRVGVVAADRR